MLSSVSFAAQRCIFIRSPTRKENIENQNETLAFEQELYSTASLQFLVFAARLLLVDEPFLAHPN